jgi:CheY-like chemotaxis protein
VALVSHEPKKLTILVVEDEVLMRMAAAEFLEGEGCEVIAAQSGEAAVAVLQRRDGIDVVVTDIRLGGEVSGWDVAEVSRSTHPDIPVVYASAAIVVPGRPVAGSVFLEKPYDLAVVLETCRALHEGR